MRSARPCGRRRQHCRHRQGLRRVQPRAGSAARRPARRQGRPRASGRTIRRRPWLRARPRTRTFQRRLLSLPATGLAGEDELNRQLLIDRVDLALDGLAFDEERMPFISGDGFYTTADYAALNTPLDDEAAAEAWIARLEALPGVLRARDGEHAPRHPHGDDATATHGRAGHCGRAWADRPGGRQVAAARPFRNMPQSFPADRRAALEARARNVLHAQVRPAQQSLLQFLEHDYLPAARPEIGIGSVPQGKEYYAYLARRHTSTTMTPAAIHALGEREVKRIRARMDQAIAQTGFKGTFQEFLASRAQGSPVLCRRRRVWREVQRSREAGGFRHAEVLRQAAAPVLWRAADAGRAREQRQRLPARHPRARRRGHGGLQALDGGEDADLRHSGLGAARRRAGPPPPDRTEPGTHGPARVPARRRRDRLRRRLGTLFGVPGRRDGNLPRPVRTVRPALARDLARVPARDRYGHARDGLVARPCDGLPAGEQRARPDGNRVRSRPLHRLARPGARLQDRRTQDH